jgi:membrane-bound lytic murein transglycosylase B
VDLFLKADAFYSIANYLREHGWSCQMDRASQHKVVYAYNHSDVYANTILAVADKLKDIPGKSKLGRTPSKNSKSHISSTPPSFIPHSEFK